MVQQGKSKYKEGQWFAVPLRDHSFALGIIVRGSYKTKGGLGYFFGPRYLTTPEDKATWDIEPDQAILITWFVDLGIVSGRWPMINSTRPFSRDEWGVPLFGRELALNPGKAFIVEYDQNYSGRGEIIRETLVDTQNIAGLPKDGFSGGGSVEIKLTKLLSNKK